MSDIFKGSSVWRMILDTETDADSPGSEELNSQYRENMEGLLIAFGYTGHGGSINTISTGSTSVISCTTAIATAADVHNGRRCIITSGSGKGNFYPISTHGTSYLTLPGADVEADGISTGDDFLVFFDFATDAHDHDGVNSKQILLEDGGILPQKLSTYIVGTYEENLGISAKSSNRGPWILLGKMKIPRGGTIRTRLGVGCETIVPNSSKFQAQIYRNGGAVGTVRYSNASASTSKKYYNQDIGGWNAGDVCELKIKNSYVDYYVTGELRVFVGNPIAIAVWSSLV